MRAVSETPHDLALGETLGLQSEFSPDTEQTGGSSTPADEPPRPGRVGRFLIIDTIGAGGMGVVYAAYDPQLDRKVALKCIRRSAARDEDDRTRFLREAQAMARLAHPNVVTVFEVGTSTDFDRVELFIAMEFVEGETLRAFCHEAGWRQIVQVFLDAGRGLAAAHAAGLVHRDFKPENVLVGADGRVRVTDFGLAREAGEVKGSAPARSGISVPITGSSALSQQLTRVGSIVGTPAYMAPEQYDGRVDPRSDQFSFAVALYEALYEALPFHARTITGQKAAIQAGPPAPDTSGKPGVPGWLREVIVRGMRPDPDARWPSMDALLAALDPAPRARKRRWLALAPIAAGIAGLTVWAGASGQEPIDPCPQAAAAIDETWNEAARQRLSAALATAKEPLAAELAGKSLKIFEDYATSWRAMRVAVCHERAHGEGQALSDQKRLCLERRRAEFGGLIIALSEGGEGLAERALRGAQGLSRLGDCEDGETLLTRLPLPNDPARVEEIEALSRELDAAHGETLAGRRDSAKGRYDALQARCEAVDHRPLLGLLRYYRGDLEGEQGALDQAFRDLRAAYWDGLATRDDDLAARSAALLVHFHAEKGEADESRRWAEHAQAMVDRVTLLNPKKAMLLGADLHNAVANLDAQAGNHAAARTTYERSLAGFAASGGAPGSKLAGIHNNLGNVLTRLGEYPSADEHLQTALNLYRETYGETHPWVASVHSNLGELRRTQGRTQEAVQAFGEASRIFRELYGDQNLQYGITRNNLGAAARELGDYATAVDHFRAAIAILEPVLGAESPHMSYPLNGLGLSLAQSGSAAEAEPLLRRAMTLADAGGPVSERAYARFGLALVADAASTEAARAAARSLAAEAAGAFRDSHAARELAEVQAWLAAHPSPPLNDGSQAFLRFRSLLQQSAPGR